MQTIKNVTIGIDWELFVNSLKTGLSVGPDRISSIIDLAKQKLPDLEIGEDMDLLEIRLGMSRGFDEFREKTYRAFETCSEIAARKKAVLVGIGYREADYNPAGGHIHAGSMETYENAGVLHNSLMPFVPALIAIAASCPDLDRSFKSVRMQNNAHHCSNPMTTMDPKLSRHLWGTDVCLKYPDKPTLELRAGDSQPNPELMCEMAALYVGLAAGLAKNKAPVFEPDIIEYGINRLNATVNGMSAMFRLGDEEISASKMISDYVIPTAIDGLSEFGTPEGPFAIAKLFAEKRMSVSDWIAAIIPPETDKYVASGEITRVIEAGGNPIEWIEKQDRLDLQAFIDPEEYLLNSITKETPLQHAFESIPLPRTYIEKMLFDMEANGKVLRTRGPRNEMLISRK